MDLLRLYFKSYEFRRKFIHLVLGIMLVAFINIDSYLIKEQLELIILALIILGLGMSIFIKYIQPKTILGILRHYDKPRDIEKFPAKGAIFYLLGVLGAIAFFDRNTASAAIIILAVGDPASHFVGKYYGRKKIIINKNKLIEGTLAGTFLGTIAASFFVPWPIAFFGAAFGMMAEAVEVEFMNLDDNFFIPLVSGIVMKLIEIML